MLKRSLVILFLLYISIDGSIFVRERDVTVNAAETTLRGHVLQAGMKSMMGNVYCGDGDCDPQADDPNSECPDGCDCYGIKYPGVCFPEGTYPY